jgi:hypothetical protein
MLLASSGNELIASPKGGHFFGKGLSFSLVVLLA